jgi:hypothetical protein
VKENQAVSSTQRLEQTLDSRGHPTLHVLFVLLLFLAGQVLDSDPMAQITCQSVRLQQLVFAAFPAGLAYLVTYASFQIDGVSEAVTRRTYNTIFPIICTLVYPALCVSGLFDVQQYCRS